MSTPNRINWPAAAALGARVVPVLLVAGVPWAFVPAGCALASVYWTGDGDPAFWPSPTHTTLPLDISAHVKPWEGLDEIEISVRARPVDGTVEVSPLTRRLVDVGGAATALLGNRYALKSCQLTKSYVATDTTLLVDATGPLGAVSATLDVYIGRETLNVTITDGATLSINARGKYGSQAKAHLAVTGYPASRVYNGIVSLQGRRMTLWLVQLDATGTLGTDPTLIYDGRVGPGSTIDGPRWRVNANHALQSVAEKARAPKVRVRGFAHPAIAGWNGVHTTAEAMYASANPLAVIWQTSTGLSPVSQDVVVYLDDTGYMGDGTTNNGGWHDSADSFLRAFQAKLAAAKAAAHLTWGLLIAVDPATGRLVIDVEPGGDLSAATLMVFALWDTNPFQTHNSAERWISSADSPFPECWQALEGGQLYLPPSDMALLPPIPGSSGTMDVASSTRANFTLAAKIGDTQRTLQVTAFGPVTAGLPRNYVTFTSFPSVQRYPGDHSGIAYLTTPTTFTLGVWVQSAYWWTAVRYLAQALAVADGFDVIDDSFAWVEIYARAIAGQSPFPAQREFAVDLGEESFLDVFTSEARFAGFMVTVARGRISIVRITDAASVETPAVTVLKGALRAGADPSVAECTDNVLTAFVAALPDGGEFRYDDRVAADMVGGGKEISTKYRAAPPAPGYELDGVYTDSGSFQQALVDFASAAIAPFREPYDVATLPLTLAAAGAELGDLVRIGDGTTPGDWLLPDGLGGRGLNGRMGTVLGITQRFYVNDRGEVDLELRLGNPNSKGYAPELLVAAGGITAGSGVLQVDTTSWGPSGFADPATDTTGGVTNFQVGDLVRLLEIDSDTPATPLDCTVTAVTPSGPTITVTPAPDAGWASRAASAFKVLLAYRDYNAATHAGTWAQHDFAFVANSGTQLLGGTDRADRWVP